MPKLKLTDAAVQRLKAPRGARVDYFDAVLPGFALRVSGPTDRNPAGRKSWVLFYRHKGELKRHTLEPVYPALGLAAARRKAGAALEMLAGRDGNAGKDPNVAKHEAKAAAARGPDTIENVIDDFMSKYMEGRKHAESYVTATRRLFDNHVLPRWRGREIGSFTRRDVIELLDAVKDGDPARVNPKGKRRPKAQGGPIVANRVLAAVRKLFNWALHRGIIETTPIARFERPADETRRERVLTVDEIGELWPAFGELGYPGAQYFRMVLATGQRRTEVATMRWNNINEAERTWTIPSESTKADRTHVVPLSPLAIEILAECKAEAKKLWGHHGSYVFTSTNAGPVSGFGQFKARIGREIAEARKKARAAAARPGGKEADALAPWTIHDLRRTCATGLGKLGIDRLVISRILNHADRTVTGIYDRFEYLPQKRHALEAWGRYLEEIVRPTGGNVVALPARAEA